MWTKLTQSWKNVWLWQVCDLTHLVLCLFKVIKLWQVFSADNFSLIFLRVLMHFLGLLDMARR